MSHYSIHHVENGMEFLRELFPEGMANEMNLCFFSTSGVHGSYTIIEEISKSLRSGGLDYECPRTITFLVIHPRIVRMSYGNAEPKTLNDIGFLKKLRQSSWDAANSIGKNRY